jgi:UPF0042 nucleotide-binding protein
MSDLGQAVPQAMGGTRPDQRRVVLVTGKSGAGMSTTLKYLEDLGHEAVDNLPLTLLRPLLDQRAGPDRPIAVVIDSRTRDFTVDMLLDELELAKARDDLDVRLLFVDCDFEILLRRYTETRRRHPLAIDRPVADGIRAETVLLKPLQDRADMVVDTSLMTIHDLRRLLSGYFSLAEPRGLFVFIMSFSFRRGLPREADLVFDVRFLKNPYWDPALRPLTGLDPQVQQAVAADPDFDRFIDGVTGLLEPLLPRYTQEGKSYLTIAVGCSGGQHRSVFVAERLAEWLRTRTSRVGLHHRDVPQGG